MHRFLLKCKKHCIYQRINQIRRKNDKNIELQLYSVEKEVKLGEGNMQEGYDEAVQNVVTL